MLKITTFGEFKIEYKHKTLHAADFNSDMLIKLFIIMCTHRNAAIESDTIWRELWPNGESSNPAGALKNLTYRLRGFLKEHFPEDEFILSGRGGYRFNPDINCEIDAECFDHLVEKIKFNNDDSQMEKNLFKAVLLYKGDYLVEIEDMRTIQIQRAYYHSEYVNVAKRICELLIETQRYIELYDLCKKIVMIERLEEEIYYYSILSCALTGNLLMGLEIYEKSVRLLKKEIGVSNFPLLNEAYEKLIKLKKEENIADISELKKNLLTCREPGPFVCDIVQFKEIYQLLVRQRIMKENPGMLVLYTLEFAFDPDKGKMERFIAEKETKAFLDVLRKQLRMGDIVSRYSESQFVIILSGCDPKAAVLVVKRIEDAFAVAYPQYSDIIISQQIDTIESLV